MPGRRKTPLPHRVQTWKTSTRLSMIELKSRPLLMQSSFKVKRQTVMISDITLILQRPSTRTVLWQFFSLIKIFSHIVLYSSCTKLFPIAVDICYKCGIISTDFTIYANRLKVLTAFVFIFLYSKKVGPILKQQISVSAERWVIRNCMTTHCSLTRFMSSLCFKMKYVSEIMLLRSEDGNARGLCTYIFIIGCLLWYLILIKKLWSRW